MRVAVIGAGHIGGAIAARLRAGADGMELCAVLASGERARGIAAPGLVPDVPALLARRPDLVIEAAHPAVGAEWGERILAQCDFLPLSLAMLADAGLHEALVAMAGRAGTRLLIPHGAVVGLDSLLEWRAQWRRVRIVFRKHPHAIDFAASGLAPRECETEWLVFAGSVRQIARRFPRNVNAMVACALATTGLDACEAALYADPRLDRAVLEIEAEGVDGSRLSIRREQPMAGVSGSEMAESTWRSLTLARGQRGPVAFA
jgi:aspartate dehydrogenase